MLLAYMIQIKRSKRSTSRW